MYYLKTLLKLQTFLYVYKYVFGKISNIFLEMENLISRLVGMHLLDP